MPKPVNFEPVKDWVSSVKKIVQNSKYGVEATRKHYESEAAAKRIFDLFGAHLLASTQHSASTEALSKGEGSRKTDKAKERIL